MLKPTIVHLKFELLASELDLPRWQVVGVLESLWLFCQYHAVDGELTDFSPKQIAAWIGWKCDAEQLIESLVLAGWLDRSDKGELFVHDWLDHCPNWVKGALKSTLGKPSDNPNAKRNAKRCARAYAPKVRKGKVRKGKALDGEKFDDFWREYPARVLDNGSRTKGSKAEAEAQFARLTEQEQADAIRGAKLLASSGQRPKDAFRWLAKRGWLDFTDCETPTKPITIDDDLEGLAGDDIAPKGVAR